MKLTFVLLTAAFIQVSAAAKAQKITLSEKNTTLEQVFRQISQQTGYRFLYTDEMMQEAKPVNVQFNNASLADALQKCLSGQPLTYSIKQKTVVIRRKPEILKPEQPPVTISGKVSDEKGETLFGVSVKIKGTSIGVSTDAEGKYSINVPEGNNTLVFSYIGFITQEVAISGRSTIDVKLSEGFAALDEVVVVGYGEQKKANLTGAVSSVNFEKLENVPQSNTLNILAGRIPGISIVQGNGQPGKGQTEVNIRGIGTLNDSSPLVIIDGVLSTLTDFGNLSPQEVANVSILKDASSAAIYGARGANGVILVTTKQPKEGKMKINFSSYYALQSPTYTQDFVQSWQWMALKNEAAGGTQRYPAFAIEDLKNGIVTDTFANTRWMDKIFRTAPMANYNLSISGGSKILSFQGSLGYLNQEGIMRGTSSARYNFRTNVTAKISGKLETGINLWGNTKRIKEPFEESTFIIQKALTTWPVIPVKYANGDWGVSYLYPGLSNNTSNPLLLTELGRTDENSLNANMQSFLQFKPFTGFNIRTAFTYSYGSGVTEKFNPTYSYPIPDGTPSFVYNLNELSNRSDGVKQIQLQTTATYDKALNKDHIIKLLAGHEYTNSKSSFFMATGNDLPGNDQQVLNRVLNNITVGGTMQEWALQSFLGRFNYGFRNKYLLEGNMRLDESSRFPSNHKYGFFPSFSAGWVLSEEDFFKKVLNDNLVNQLKLRGGWGKVGNDRIGNYTYSQQLNLGSYYNYGNTLQLGAAITDFANPDISWEATTTANLGLDAALLKNRVFINFDIFKRLTDGILYRLPLAPSIGDTNPAILNIAKVSNNGWDLNLEHRNKVGAWNYNIGFNVAYVKNKIVDLATRQAISDKFILREGDAIGSYYGYIYEGLFRDSADLKTYPPFSTNGLKIGAMRFRDVNGDGVINPDDRQVIGSANTPYTFGLSGGSAFKGFDFNFLFQGVKDKYIYLYDSGNRPGNAANANFWKEWWDNRFDPVENPDGTWPVLKGTSPEAAETSTFWLHDASYIRLKNIELGYSLPQKILTRLHISNLRFYAAGQNLLTFSNLIKQVDPERASTRTDNQSYPQVKVISFGFNSSF